MITKKLLWLDDVRDPKEWNSFFCIPNCEVVWVKSYNEFKKYILKNGLPDAINFDHDLAPEHYTPEKYWSDYEESKRYQESQVYTNGTGFDCARWIIIYCIKNNLKLPTYASHSANPVGRDKIINILNLFKDVV